MLTNYTSVEFTINPVKANVYALFITLPTVIIIGLLYYLIWREQFTMENIRIEVIQHKSLLILAGPIIFIVTIAGIIMHEFIHGLTWSLYTKHGFKSIKYGMHWKMLTPYCHCKEPLTIGQYLIGAIMPSIVLGILPCAFGLINGNIFILLFGTFFTIAAAGDFMVIYLLRTEDKNNLVQDHPTKIGCIVYRKTE